MTDSKIQSLYLAGGCFWGLEELIRTQDGVVDTEVGYMGGENEDPTYRNHPGHAEAVRVDFNPIQTDVRTLLQYFFRIHNPTTLNQQGNDKGSSYRSAIFYQNEQEYNSAQETITMVNNSGKWDDPLVTTLEPFVAFWPAEDYHQDYLQKNPGGYTCHQEYFDEF